MYPIYKSIGTKEKCKTVKIQFPPLKKITEGLSNSAIYAIPPWSTLISVNVE